MKKTILLVLVLALGLATEVAKADFTFGTPTNLGPMVNTSSIDAGPSISADGLSLFFSSDRSGGYGGQDLWVTTRETINDPWGEPVNLGSTVNSSASDAHPDISANDRELYFRSPRPGGFGGHDLWVTTRATVSDPWEPPVNLGSLVNTSSRDSIPYISADGLSLFFASNRPGGFGDQYDLWVTTRETINDPWGEPVNLGPTVNSSYWEEEPCISADGLALFFSSERPPGEYLSGDIWVATRPTTNDEWGKPVNLGPNVNTSYVDTAPDISANGSILYFHSNRGGGSGVRDLWQVSIEPVVDFNGDGIVDAADMCIMVDYWDEDYSLCDIGPMPWGNGTVDVHDLIVLSEYLTKELNDSTLIAHWALDELEGTIAQDSAGTNDAVTFGGPLWQPTGGQVDGAVQLDGIDDCVIIGSVSNPTEGPFSVLAWIKSGTPGQVILSQIGGVNWLCTDSLEGNLMTELKGTGRSAAELLSQTIITDGNWHRIGLVWDGSSRILYVDGVAVAQDMQEGLEGSDSGLYLGCGKAMESGTFWSGLIDDVRIYNRVVMP